MHLCVMCIDFTSLYNLGIVPTVWEFFVRISENNKTFDLFTLYTTIPHRSNELLQHCFTITNDRRRSSYLVVGRGTTIIF